MLKIKVQFLQIMQIIKIRRDLTNQKSIIYIKDYKNRDISKDVYRDEFDKMRELIENLREEINVKLKIFIKLV